MANECLTTLSLTFFTQKTLWQTFFKRKCDFRWKTAVLRFSAAIGGLGATNDVHLRLIEKRVVYFLFVLIELFLLGVAVLRMRRYERISIENRRFRSNGVSLTQYFR